VDWPTAPVLYVAYGRYMVIRIGVVPRESSARLAKRFTSPSDESQKHVIRE